jgi:hypothetical protein
MLSASRLVGTHDILFVILALQGTGVKLDTAGQHNQTGPFEEGDTPEYLYEGDIE